MPETPEPPDSVSVPLDGVSAPVQAVEAAPAAAKKSEPAVRRWKGVLLVLLLVAYVVYGAWSFVLMGLLPSNDPALKQLPLLGLLVALIGGVGFLGLGAIMLQRISLSRADARARVIALGKVILAVVPGLLLSVMVPLVTMRAIPIVMEITSPTSLQDMVAPVAMTFSVQDALPGLAAEGFVPVEFRWDVNADKKTDQETSIPELTATFEREGSYRVAVVMLSASGVQKSATKSFVIRSSVFKVTPMTPIVNQVAEFSLAHLYEPQGTVKEVRWDFNNDGVIDQTTTSLTVMHTFFQVGSSMVRASVDLLNNTQTVFERAVTVVEPPPLPFPVTLSTEPKTLIGSPPFPVLFSMDAEILPAKIEWNFGDGETALGPKTAHTFTKKGTFPVNLNVYSQSGVVATLQTIVKVVDPLRLSDLTFEGTPELRGGTTVEGEVPLSLNLTPVTSTPFIQFQWEAPEATDVGSTETSLQAIYRREGTYTVTLIAQDLEDHVLRMPITVRVKPASTSLVIAMDPETGVAPLAVRFDASESFIPGETITGFVWNYGDGSKEEFGGASAQHTFEKEGTYSIGLTARTTSGKNYATKKTLIVREPLLRACITPSRIRGTAPLGVDFDSDCSVGTPDTYLWDFGDGAQSDQADVIHVFEAPGTYDVTLTVTEGDATHTSTVTITAQP